MTPDFKCAICADKQVTPFRVERLVYRDISLKYVDKFCYFGDMISVGGGVEAAVNARIRSGWRMFRELLPLLTSKGTSLRKKGKLYAACVGSVMMYGSKTWVITKEDERRCERNEMRMVRWMCDVTEGSEIKCGMKR